MVRRDRRRSAAAGQQVAVRNALETGLGYALVVGLVAAVILGRRRGKQSRAASEANAYAAGYARGGEAAAAAYANQSVTVAVDASRRDGAGATPDEHWCVDPMDCGVCAPVLHRIARRSIEGSAAYHSAADLAANHRPAEFDGARLRRVPVEPGAVGRPGPGSAGRAADGRGVLAPEARK